MRVQRRTDDPLDRLVEDNFGETRPLRERSGRQRRASRPNDTASTTARTRWRFCDRTTTTARSRAGPVALDLHLAGQDGCDVLAAIRADVRLRRLPVIMLTSSTATEDVARCHSAHTDAYLTKPVNLDGLVSTVEALERFWLDRASLQPAPQ